MFAASEGGTTVISKKKQVIAIGGRSLVAPYAIERDIIQQTRKERPKVCFLPQATGEKDEYKVRFYTAFSALGAHPSDVSLFGMVDPTKVAAQLLSQDIIYVGGGNTKSMLALWREWGIDDLLLQAYEQGTILAGVSAGAICWFEQGITDSKIPLSTLPCLGILPGACCPHYDSEVERRPYYTRAVGQQALSGIALEDHTAAHYIDGQLTRVLSWVPGKKAYMVAPDGHTELDVELLS
jgi:peptidase E